MSVFNYFSLGMEYVHFLEFFSFLEFLSKHMHVSFISITIAFIDIVVFLSASNVSLLLYWIYPFVIFSYFYTTPQAFNFKPDRV